MSTLSLLLRENPLPGLALASLNVVVALSLVGLSLLLGATLSLLTWAHAVAERKPAAVKLNAKQRSFR